MTKLWIVEWSRDQGIFFASRSEQEATRKARGLSRQKMGRFSAVEAEFSSTDANALIAQFGGT